MQRPVLNMFVMTCDLHKGRQVRCIDVPKRMLCAIVTAAQEACLQDNNTLQVVPKGHDVRRQRPEATMLAGGAAQKHVEMPFSVT